MLSRRVAVGVWRALDEHIRESPEVHGTGDACWPSRACSARPRDVGTGGYNMDPRSSSSSSSSSSSAAASQDDGRRKPEGPGKPNPGSLAKSKNYWTRRTARPGDCFFSPLAALAFGMRGLTQQWLPAPPGEMMHAHLALTAPGTASLEAVARLLFLPGGREKSSSGAAERIPSTPAPNHRPDAEQLARAWGGNDSGTRGRRDPLRTRNHLHRPGVSAFPLDEQ
ncbi:hypothetical protein JHW43_008879 [Diplocarpon mali]|nr:hypothetical protein JHW43_008879 [Diplocarpon mali]